LNKDRVVFYPIEDLAHRYQWGLITALANPINIDLIGEAMINNTSLDELRELNSFLTCIKFLSRNSEIPSSALYPHLKDINDKLEKWLDSCEDEPEKAEVIQLRIVRK